MDPISLIVTIVVIGLLLWLIDMLPIDPKLKSIIHVIVVVVVILWLISFLVPSLGLHQPLVRR
jgi:hypothetical protein